MVWADAGRLALRATAAVSLLAGPIAYAQGRRVRQNTPRLPEAPGARHGRTPGRGPALRLVALGESPVAGVGLEHLAHSLTPRLAARLADPDRPVDWQILARTGATAQSLRERLLPELPVQPAHLVVVAVGVNDCLAMRSPRRWQDDLERLFDAISDRCDRPPILLSGIPPMARFPALPQPLAGILGLRARLLDAVSRRIADERDDVHFASMRWTGRADGLFARDGFHPSAEAHGRWARELSVPARSLLERGRRRNASGA